MITRNIRRRVSKRELYERRLAALESYGLSKDAGHYLFQGGYTND